MSAVAEVEVRAVRCPECNGMGEWDEGPINTSLHGGPADPEYRQVICPECEGTGKVLTEVEPITLEDISGDDATTDYLRFRGKCKELSEAAVAADPTLTLVLATIHHSDSVSIIFGHKP